MQTGFVSRILFGYAASMLLVVVMASTAFAQTPCPGVGLGVRIANDTDSDGCPDSTDNCPFFYNPSQADANGNGAGDICDKFGSNSNPVTISFPEGGGGGGGLVYDRIDGCFALGTKILLSDKRSKSVEDIRAGDSVWNPLSESAQNVAKVVLGPEPHPLFAIAAGDYSVTVTSSHPFVVRAAGAISVVAAKNLSVGSEVLLDSGRWEAIAKITKLPIADGQKVANIALEGGDEFSAHAISANGIATGDLFLQTGKQ